MKPSKTLQGLPRHKNPFMFPILVFRKGFSLLGLPHVPKSRDKKLTIREVRKCRIKGKTSHSRQVMIA